MRTASSILVALLVITSATAAFDAVATGADDAGDSAQSPANVTSAPPQEQRSVQPPRQTTKPAAEPVAKPTDAAVNATGVKNETAESVTGGDAVSEVRDLIRKRYAGKKDEQALTEAAIRGLLQGLNDPYSEFLPQEKLRTFEQELQGTLAGIGAQLAPEKDRLIIVAPLPGSPAQKAGLQPRDAITAIDGKSAHELTLEQAVQAIRGPVGTQVRLRITRANGNEEEVVVTRGNIQLPSVKGWSVDREGTWNHWLNKDSAIGFVRISEFRSRTAKEFESALQQLTGMKGLILDLRHNPGGQLTVVVEIAQMLLQQGTIVTVWVGEKQESSYQAAGKATAPSVPLVVLIDEKTASAAEILAGALKDNDRAVLLGARTFGKGSVQAIHQLAGQGAVKLTTAHFRLPSGRNIDRQAGATTWGVDPTDGYFVPLSTEEQATWQRIRGQKDLPATTPVEAPSMTEAALERDFADPQLAAAMKTLSARISQGAFIKTGRSEEQLRAYYERHDQLRRQREAALKALQEIDGEISKLAP